MTVSFAAIDLLAV